MVDRPFYRSEIFPGPGYSQGAAFGGFTFPECLICGPGARALHEKSIGLPISDFGLFFFQSTFRNSEARPVHETEDAHDFCVQCSCSQARHLPENNLSEGSIQSALRGFLFFIPPGLPEVLDCRFMVSLPGLRAGHSR